MTEPQEPGQAGQPQDPQGQPSAQEPPAAAYGQPEQPACPSQQPPCGQQPRYMPPQGAYGQQPLQGQPGQPAPDGYGQPGPPWGAYGQPAQQPFQQPGQPPYGQPGRPPYQQPPVPPMPPYQPQAYAQPPLQPRKKAWPWVLGICLLVVVLGLGGCVGCVSCAMYLDDGYNGSFDPRYDDSDGTNSGRGYGYGYGSGSSDDGGDDSSGYEGSLYLSRNDIEAFVEEEYGSLPSRLEDGAGTPGIFEVGVGKDLEPGLYYLEGSQTEESNFLVFEQEGADAYELDDSVVYFGNYFTQLEPGDLIVFAGPKGSHLYPAAKASVEAASPYQSGVYRVGIDVPAGTYAVTVQAEASAATEYESAAYVMKDLEFEDDSIVETKYVIAGGSQTITVTDGQYVELFAAVMEPMNP